MTQDPTVSSATRTNDGRTLRRILAGIALLLSLLSGLGGVVMGILTTVGEDFQMFSSLRVIGYGATGALLLTGTIGLLLAVAALRR